VTEVVVRDTEGKERKRLNVIIAGPPSLVCMNNIMGEKMFNPDSQDLR